MKNFKETDSPHGHTCEICGRKATAVVRDIMVTIRADTRPDFNRVRRLSTPHFYCAQHDRRAKRVTIPI